MPVTGRTNARSTLSLIPVPSFAVAVIFATPAATPVTSPFASTVAIFVLLDFQSNCCRAFSGYAFAESWTLPPTSYSRGVKTGSNFTNDVGRPTVTVQLAAFPFSVVAVIVAVPTPIASTVPFDITVAISGFDERQTTSSGFASLGLMVAASFAVPLTSSESDFGIDTEVGVLLTYSFIDLPKPEYETMTSAVPAFEPAFTVAVPSPLFMTEMSEGDRLSQKTLSFCWTSESGPATSVIVSPNPRYAVFPSLIEIVGWRGTAGSSTGSAPKSA